MLTRFHVEGRPNAAWWQAHAREARAFYGGQPRHYVLHKCVARFVSDSQASFYCYSVAVVIIIAVVHWPLNRGREQRKSWRRTRACRRRWLSAARQFRSAGPEIYGVVSGKLCPQNPVRYNAKALFATTSHWKVIKYSNKKIMKKRSDRRNHCALAGVRRSQKFSTRRRPSSLRRRTAKI